ncbi:MAG: DUF6078 family protein [Bacteroidaceae bacterium]|nr:DUF6078 family protein [Bacteroidaceae bacterium]
MPKKTYTTLPENFSACLHADCPMAGKCLRQVAYSQMMENMEKIYMINPRHCTKDEKCKFYRDATPVRYAKGFTKFQKHLLPEQYQEFMSVLIVHFGRGGYFYRRRGVVALSPVEQEVVLNALRSTGFKEDLPFDSYEELYNWFD